MIIERAIEKEDLPKIAALVKEALGADQYAGLERLGGNTNHSYHVTMSDGKEYLVRLPGVGTEEIIVRNDERISTKLAGDLGIDTKILLFDADGAKVMEYVPNAVTMDEESMKEKRHIEQAAEIFRKLHGCGVDTGVPFEVFDMAATYEKVIYDNDVPMPADYPERKAQVAAIKAEVDANSPAPKVPCHNDPLCANWVEGNGRMYLVDWEYAGMNDGMWDIAAVSIESCYEEEHDLYFLEKYLGRVPTAADRKHLIASKIYVDYLWTLWAKMRVPVDGQPMEDWAAERYARMIGFIEQYQKI